MPDIRTYRIRYTGPAPLASLVEQILRNEGLAVSWTPPEEQRGVGEVLDQVSVSLIVTATTAAARAAVAKVRERLRGRGTVEIEDDDAK